MAMVNVIEKRLINYAVDIIKLSVSLKNIEASQVLISQILRSGTSPALNYGEAQNAQSKKDFIHKVRIAYKELRETYINLMIIEKAGLCRNLDLLGELVSETGELLAIFTSIIKTARNNMKNN